jgi:hypothetical protein
MNDYKGVTAAERIASLKITQKAIKEGIIPKPVKCQLCGKTTGRIDYHSETYKSPTEGLLQICQGCHMRWHNRNRYPESFCRFMSENDRFKKINQDMKDSLQSEGFTWDNNCLTKTNL